MELDEIVDSVERGIELFDKWPAFFLKELVGDCRTRHDFFDDGASAARDPVVIAVSSGLESIQEAFEYLMLMLGGQAAVRVQLRQFRKSRDCSHDGWL